MMQLPRSAIVAIDKFGGFAKDKQIPWDFPEDLKRFKQITSGGICVMGKNTYLDINERMGDKGTDQVLPDRTSYVVSSTLTNVTNATVVSSIEDLYVGQIKGEHYDNNLPLFFIGGKSIFDLAIQGLADQLFVTIIDMDYECDTFIDLTSLTKLFTLVSNEKSVERSDARFLTFVRTR